ncbi:ribonuclease 2 [Amborella trichopoda]|uniref:ribonuclease 2 n=1 Tax=Amborella trichopoda TaxID=13333 RepID=UPI0005D30A9E|nr:ribonuclease 2 [Amborella trichopoda]|eukprot:XP_011628780.1 ribonuclease 2 [Amborella trichopoda]
MGYSNGYLSLFFCILMVMASVQSTRDHQREFDYFLLALQWPGTICQRTHHCCSSNACCRRSSSPTEFTIHGLWVDYNDGSWPACCGRSDFDENKITALIGTLEKYWPSLYCGSSSVCHGGKGSIWAHEVHLDRFSLLF